MYVPHRLVEQLANLQCTEVLATIVHLTQHVTNVGTGSVHRCVSLQCTQSTLLNHVRSSRCRIKNFASLNMCLPNGKAMMMTARLCDQTPRMTVMSRYSNVCSPQAGAPASRAVIKFTKCRGSCRIWKSRQRTNVGTGSVHRCLTLQCAQSTHLNHVRSSRCRSKNFASLAMCLPNGKAMMMKARLCDQTPRMTVMSSYSNVCSAQAGRAIGKLTMYRGSCHICPSDAACHECGNRFRTPLCQLVMHAVHSFKSCSII